MGKKGKLQQYNTKHWLGDADDTTFVCTYGRCWEGISTMDIALHGYHTGEVSFNTVKQLDKLIKPLLEARKWLEIHGSKAPKK